MNPNADPARDHVASLRMALEVRAAGLWRAEADRLVQVAFVPSPDLAPAIAVEFAGATRSVSLDRADLGIVRAFRSGEAAISVAERLPADAGSGRWLRAFGASRSVAVPLADPSGVVAAVVSVALRSCPLPDEAVADLIRARGLPDSPPPGIRPVGGLP